MHQIDRATMLRSRQLQTDAPMPLDETKLLGCRIVNDNVGATLDWLCFRLQTGQPTRVAFLNAHCANLRAQSPDYADALDTADAVLPDGAGVALALRMRGETLNANLKGTDLIPALCHRLAAGGHSVYLLGGRTGVAEAAAASLVAIAPGLKIAGWHHGFFSAAQEPAIIRDINASGAAVVLVALGVPAQDLWLHRNAARLRAPLSFGVGGLFDFLSGRIPRAPAALRRAGLEWTYRLYQERRGCGGATSSATPNFCSARRLKRCLEAAQSPAGWISS